MDIVNLSFGNVSVCDVIDEFCSLKRTQCFFAKKSPTAFKVKLKRLWCRRFCVTWQWMSIELVQSNPCALESKSNRGWKFTLTFCGITACASSGARIGILQTKGQAFVFANRTLPAFALEFTGSRAESMPCDRRIPQCAKNTMPVWREISQQFSRSSWRDFDVAGFVPLGNECP